MSVIIRLQNLPWTANAMDIRHFFNGLNIPDGGVHIVGGEQGDAFIAFATDEDARRAMLQDRYKVKDNIVRLFLSSKTEMQNVIVDARKSSSAAVPPQQPPDLRGIRHTDNFQGIGLVSLPQNLADLRIPLTQHGLSSSLFMQHGNMLPSNADQPVFNSPPCSFSSTPVGIHLHDDHQRSNKINGKYLQRPDRPVLPSDKMDKREYPERESDRDRNRRNRHLSSRSPHRIRGGSRNRDRSRERLQGHSRERKREHDSPIERQSHRSHGESRRDHRDYCRSSPDRRRSPPHSRVSYKGPPTACILVSSIPPSTSYKEIRKFFRGLDIPRDGLKLLRGRGRDKIAYVRFFEVDFAQEAVKKDGEILNEGKLQIELVSTEEFEQAADMFSPTPKIQRGPIRESYTDGPPQDKGPVMDRHLLPCSFDPEHECHMSHGVLGTDRMGPSLGDRRPPFHRHPGRPGPPSEFIRDFGHDSAIVKDDSPGLQCSPCDPTTHLGYCLMVSNLPPDLQRDDLRNFFFDQKLVRGGMYIEYDIDGVCMGRAYIEFLREVDLQGALKKNGLFLDKHDIKMILTTKEAIEMQKRQHKELIRQQHAERDSVRDGDEKGSRSFPAPRRGPPPLLGRQHTPTHHRGSSPLQPSSHQCVRLHGIPYSSTIETILDFFHGIHIKPEQIKILYKNPGEASGVAFVELSYPADHQQALNRDKQYIGKRYINVSHVSKEEAQREIEDFHQQMLKPRQRNLPLLGGRGMSGSNTIYLHNLPYAVTPEEVLELLQGFGAIPDSLRFREEGGKRTGEAMIVLNHPGAVDKAVHELQGHQVRGRVVTITN